MTSPVADSNTRQSAADLAVDFACFASKLDATGFDDTAVKAVKADILDTLSCALASSSAKAIAEVTSMVSDWGDAPQADMFVFGGKFPAPHAAGINRGMSHACDYDDTHDGAILHAGVTAALAAIAAAQLPDGVSGADLNAAVPGSLEVTCRLGVASQLAQRGIRGAQHVFEGADGFFRVYLRDRADTDVARRGLGQRFELLNLIYKPYPCCRDTRAAVDAVSALTVCRTGT